LAQGLKLKVQYLINRFDVIERMNPSSLHGEGLLFGRWIYRIIDAIENLNTKGGFYESKRTGNNYRR
jgi:hypothetical protein